MELAQFYSTEEGDCQAPLSFSGVVATVLIFGVSGLVWAFRNVRKVTSINLDNNDIDLDDSLSMRDDMVSPPQKKLLLELGEKIS